MHALPHPNKPTLHCSLLPQVKMGGDGKPLVELPKNYILESLRMAHCFDLHILGVSPLTGSTLPQDKMGDDGKPLVELPKNYLAMVESWWNCC